MTTQAQIMPTRYCYPRRKCVDLWAGDSTGMASARLHGDEVVTVDNNPIFNSTITADILDISPDDIRDALNLRPGERIFFLWASIDCSVFSPAGFPAKHFNEDRSPRSDKAHGMVARAKHTLALIECLDPVYFVIENPRGLLRKMEWMQHLPRATVCYCRYGDSRMKPTDLFGRFPRSWIARPMCSPGNPDHAPAPRGSRNGTQGMKKREAAHIPIALSHDLYDAAIASNGETFATLEEFL